MPSRIVIPRPTRPKREQKPAPACGIIVRQVRGIRVQPKPEAPGGHDAGETADQLFAALRNAPRGE